MIGGGVKNNADQIRVESVPRQLANAKFQRYAKALSGEKVHSYVVESRAVYQIKRKYTA
jgi:hypothetical protein